MALVGCLDLLCLRATSLCHYGSHYYTLGPSLHASLDYMLSLRVSLCCRWSLRIWVRSNQTPSVLLIGIVVGGPLWPLLPDRYTGESSFLFCPCKSLILLRFLGPGGFRGGRPCKSLKSLENLSWASGQSSAHPLSIEVSLVPCALCLLRLILLYYTQGVQKSTPNYQNISEKRCIFWLTFWINGAILKA